VVYEDSSFNQWGYWTSMQDCMKGYNDRWVFLFRRYGDGSLGSGALALLWTVDGGTSWTVDWPINDGLLNDPHPGSYFGRYCTGGYHTDFPYGSWPELLPGGSDWGYGAVGNEIDWETAGFYGVISENIGVHKNWSWERESDGMVVGCAQDVSDNNFTWVYDPLMGDWDTAPTAQPQLAGFSTYAQDYRDGDWLLFGYHSSLGGVAYSTSDNGYDSWTTPALLDPPGMPTGWTVYWMDACFGLDDNPIYAALELDATGGLDQANEIWFFRPDTAIRLDPGMDYYNHYAQFGLDHEGGVIWVWWHEATHADMDPAIEGWRHDIWYSMSQDDGYTWSAPVNITETDSVNEQMMHVGRYTNAFSYLTPLDGSQVDLYYGCLATTSYEVYESRVFIDNNYIFGDVTEESRPGLSRQDLGLRAVYQARERSLRVEFSLPSAGDVDLQVYNEAGRSALRHLGYYGEGTHVETFHTSNLPAGTYILRLDVGGLTKTAKFVVLR
jgi:hypothetical protein